MTTAARKPTIVRDDAKVLENAVAAGKETIETVLKAGTEATQKGFEQAVAMTQEQVAKASTAFFKGYDDLTVFSKENVEAVVRAGSIYAKGVEELGRAVVTLTQTQVESTVAAAKAAMGCTTLRQIVDLNTDLAKTSFDKIVAEGSKLSEMSMKVANEAFQPIQARVNVAVEKFAKPAA